MYWPHTNRSTCSLLLWKWALPWQQQCLPVVQPSYFLSSSSYNPLYPDSIKEDNITVFFWPMNVHGNMLILTAEAQAKVFPTKLIWENMSVQGLPGEGSSGNSSGLGYCLFFFVIYWQEMFMLGMWLWSMVFVRCWLNSHCSIQMLLLCPPLHTVAFMNITCLTLIWAIVVVVWQSVCFYTFIGQNSWGGSGNISLGGNTKPCNCPHH